MASDETTRGRRRHLSAFRLVVVLGGVALCLTWVRWLEGDQKVVDWLLLHQQMDKAMHAVCFGLIAAFLGRSLSVGTDLGWPIAWTLGVLGAVIIGGIDEGLEAVVSRDEFEFFDFLADTLGAAGIGPMILGAYLSFRRILTTSADKRLDPVPQHPELSELPRPRHPKRRTHRNAHRSHTPRRRRRPS